MTLLQALKSFLPQPYVDYSKIPIDWVKQNGEWKHFYTDDTGVYMNGKRFA